MTAGISLTRPSPKYSNSYKHPFPAIENSIKNDAERLLPKRRNDMKKIVFRLIALSLSVSLAGCQTARQNEKTWQQIGNVRPFFKNEKNLLPDRKDSKNNHDSESNRFESSSSKKDNGKIKQKGKSSAAK